VGARSALGDARDAKGAPHVWSGLSRNF
jgi:hypothetical protein